MDDFRNDFNIKYKLVDILTIAVLAVLSGLETWDEMELYGRERHSLLKKFLELPASIPSHDTFIVCSPYLIQTRSKQPCRIG